MLVELRPCPLRNGFPRAIPFVTIALGITGGGRLFEMDYTKR
jgi:hypothetical protein